MPRHIGRRQVTHRADGEVRRSQVVTTFGPGAMVDLIADAVVIGGLDNWMFDKRNVIQEPRLRDHVAERLRRMGVMLSLDSAFREPPLCDDKAPNRAVGVWTLEFPQWSVCQNPGCRALKSNRALERKSKGGSEEKQYVHQCTASRATETIPVRFVGACRRGHLQDFPWNAFVHLGAPSKCEVPEFVLKEGKTGDFSEIVVECACGASNHLVAAMRKDSPLTCGGERPWLGGEDESCDEQLRLIVRTASNSYFSQVTSALSIPDVGRELEHVVRVHLGILQAATPQTLPAFRQIPAIREALADYDDAAVLAVVDAIRRGETVPREPLRDAEFKLLSTAAAELPGERPPRGAPFWARTIAREPGLPDSVKAIVNASKLREVRAQLGFTRIVPVMPDMQGTYESGVRTARLSLAQDWLPATEILGEGVFLQLDEEAVRAWERRPAVQKRAKELEAGYDAWRSEMLAQNKGAEGAEALPPFPGPRFYMLHALSHLLISAISLDCGYAASAIRERVYGSLPDEPDCPMAAILLSTGTSGTEGTLGGLVEQGRVMAKHLQRAMELGRLCSNDPVCALHTPANDRAERHLEGAACHGCLYTAECSCEWFNRYLDRALVVPTLGHDADLAFFA